MATPADIANQALVAIGRGADIVLGDLTEGTREAKVILTAYSQCLRQLLRAANWDFARKQAPLVLLADQTGQTPNVGNLVSAQNYIYEYAYPIDCMRVTAVVWNGLLQPAIPPNNIQLPQPDQISSTVNPPFFGVGLRPARFKVGTDYNYLPDPSLMYEDIQGISQQGRTVIFTNVREAQIVYTALMTSPSVWDSLFRAAFVAYLASEIAIPLTVDQNGKTDLKMGMAIANRLIPIVKKKITEARIADGNEGLTSTDHIPDWMRVRNNGSGRAGYWTGQAGVLMPGGDCGSGDDGWGGYGMGWGSCLFSDGSSF
jgi:hypothetical protein